MAKMMTLFKYLKFDILGYFEMSIICPVCHCSSHSIFFLLNTT